MTGHGLRCHVEEVLVPSPAHLDHPLALLWDGQLHFYGRNGLELSVCVLCKEPGQKVVVSCVLAQHGFRGDPPLYVVGVVGVHAPGRQALYVVLVPQELLGLGVHPREGHAGTDASQEDGEEGLGLNGAQLQEHGVGGGLLLPLIVFGAEHLAQPLYFGQRVVAHIGGKR